MFSEIGPQEPWWGSYLRCLGKPYRGSKASKNQQYSTSMWAPWDGSAQFHEHFYQTLAVKKMFWNVKSGDNGGLLELPWTAELNEWCTASSAWYINLSSYSSFGVQKPLTLNSWKLGNHEPSFCYRLIVLFASVDAILGHYWLSISVMFIMCLTVLNHDSQVISKMYYIALGWSW